MQLIDLVKLGKMNLSFTQLIWSEELKKSSRPRQDALKQKRKLKQSKRKSKEN